MGNGTIGDGHAWIFVGAETVAREEVVGFMANFLASIIGVFLILVEYILVVLKGITGRLRPGGCCCAGDILFKGLDLGEVPPGCIFHRISEG